MPIISLDILGVKLLKKRENDFDILIAPKIAIIKSRQLPYETIFDYLFPFRTP